MKDCGICFVLFGDFFFTRAAATYLIFISFPFLPHNELHDIGTLDRRALCFVFSDAGVWRYGCATIPHWDGSYIFNIRMKKVFYTTIMCLRDDDDVGDRATVTLALRRDAEVSSATQTLLDSCELRYEWRSTNSVALTDSYYSS